MDYIEKKGYSYSKSKEQAKIMQLFSARFTKYMNAPRPFLLPTNTTVREVYILATIEENPGILTVEIAKLWDVTPGAISQVVKKLKERDFLDCNKEDGNAKLVHLYTTEKGSALVKEHETYILNRWDKIEKEVLANYSMEEVDHFFKMMEVISEFYNA